MTDYWNAIEERLHEESALHYPTNKVRLILRAYVNGLLNTYQDDAYDFFSQGFLLTCSGDYLDNRGKEMGLSRLSGENDDSYRQRLFNFIGNRLTVHFVKKQGVILYTKNEIDNNIRSYMTSNNPYLKNCYAGIPKTSVADSFLENDVIYNDYMETYKKGW